VGKKDAIAGLSIPGSIFNTNLEIAIKAPVLPALTHAFALPSLIRLTAILIDEFFFVRRA
jgi:hypothetical protein